MKRFITLRKKISESLKLRFWKDVVFVYLLLMVLYGYFMLADLSTAPQFVYTQF